MEDRIKKLEDTVHLLIQLVNDLRSKINPPPPIVVREEKIKEYMELNGVNWEQAERELRVIYGSAQQGV